VIYDFTDMIRKSWNASHKLNGIFMTFPWCHFYPFFNLDSCSHYKHWISFNGNNCVVLHSFNTRL